MAKQENLSFVGTIVEELGNSMFKVELDINNNSFVICTISGKIRKNYIRVMTGDRVKIEVSPYYLTKGRIVARLTTTKNDSSNSSNNSNNKKKKK